MVKTEVMCTVPCRCTKRFHVAHSTLCQAPQFPVCAKALQLTVRTEVYFHPRIGKQLARFRRENMSVLVLFHRRHGAVACARINYGTRHVLEQLVFFPHIHVLVPVHF